MKRSQNRMYLGEDEKGTGYPQKSGITQLFLITPLHVLQEKVCANPKKHDIQ